MHELVSRMKDEKTLARLKIQTVALRVIHEYMAAHGVYQLMPVMLSTVTDPLAHPVEESSLTYLGQKLELTKSMLLHKQAAMIAPGLEKLYIVSPNIRLETAECKASGRHLIEFSQVDIEFKGATKEEFMRFMEGMVIAVISTVKEECSEELALLDRRLVIPTAPFASYESKEAAEAHGSSWEKHLSTEAKEPFWILDLEREFYDKEDPERKGYYHNYDLIWPEGFEEALSGAERDFEYEVLLRKLAERGQSEAEFAPYMALAKEGHLVATAGGGLGVERLVRFLSGTRHIKDVPLFPRTPGEEVLI
jgi:asparaginyl-tRNA synthetase